jgi:hypothetical protein
MPDVNLVNAGGPHDNNTVMVFDEIWSWDCSRSYPHLKTEKYAQPENGPAVSYERDDNAPFRNWRYKMIGIDEHN